MYNRTLFNYVIAGFICLFISCNTTTPEQYFDQAVLNSNLLAGFADRGDFRQLDAPSSKMDEQKKVVSSTRAEVVEMKQRGIEAALKKIKDLAPTEETKPMIDASVAVFEFVLPVYKNEYVELAKKYDTGAPKEELEAMMTAIHNKYYAKYDQLYNALINQGKTYAAKHDIKVNWAN